MKRSYLSLSAVVALAATAAMAGGARAQVNLPPGTSRVITAAGGRTLVLSAPATVVKSQPTVRTTASVKFRAIPWSEKLEMLKQAGMPAPAQPPSGPFTLTPRAPYVDGKGYMMVEVATVNDPYFNVVDAWSTTPLGQRVNVAVMTSLAQQFHTFMIHFDVQAGPDAGSWTVHNFMDNSYTDIPIKPNQRQDIVVFVLVPTSGLPGDKVYLASLTQDAHRQWKYYGVEVTSM